MSANYKQVITHFESKSAEVRTYFGFDTFSQLAKSGYDWDVILPYIFAQVEAGKRETLYCGISKYHATDSTLTRRIIGNSRLDRKEFYLLFKKIFNVEIDELLKGKLETAENIRDAIMHGKGWSGKEAREALRDIFDFAEDFNVFVQNVASFKPFGGDMRGLTGRKKKLSQPTTLLVLKGLGISKE